MIDRLLSHLAPHYCSFCLEIGLPVCESCKDNIVIRPLETCLQCHAPLHNNSCLSCAPPYQFQAAFYPRTDMIATLIDSYKFHGVRPLSNTIVNLLDEPLPYFPGETIFVPIPTLRAHVRMRGFDHVERFTRPLAKRRRVYHLNLLNRQHNTRQLGATRRQRLQQAKGLFICRRILSADVTYVLLDDVTTTGATLTSAAQALKDAGATKIAVVAFAYQPSN